jgi:gliding motility-associated lipoprotein GldH
MKISLPLLVISLFFLSCDPQRIYEKNINIKRYSWSSENVLKFPVQVKDTSLLYDIYLNIRHADLYPYRNIWIIVGTEFPDGSRSTRRLEVLLANESGRWYGDGLGDIFDYRTLIQEKAYFDQQGTYTFTLEQNMRQDPLPGIMSAGIRIENTGFRKSNTQLAE